MAEKMLLMVQTAYNLVRALMQEATMEETARTSSLSFKQTLEVIWANQSRYQGVKNRSLTARKLHQEILDLIAGVTLPIRPQRREPRARKLRPKNYQLLMKHRHFFKEQIHRGKRQKSA